VLPLPEVVEGLYDVRGRSPGKPIVHELERALVSLCAGAFRVSPQVGSAALSAAVSSASERIVREQSGIVSSDLIARELVFCGNLAQLSLHNHSCVTLGPIASNAVASFEHGHLTNQTDYEQAVLALIRIARVYIRWPRHVDDATDQIVRSDRGQVVSSICRMIRYADLTASVTTRVISDVLSLSLLYLSAGERGQADRLLDAPLAIGIPERIRYISASCTSQRLKPDSQWPVSQWSAESWGVELTRHKLRAAERALREKQHGTAAAFAIVALSDFLNAGNPADALAPFRVATEAVRELTDSEWIPTRRNFRRVSGQFAKQLS
jgi:hypothetical protein